MNRIVRRARMRVRRFRHDHFSSSLYLLIYAWILRAELLVDHCAMYFIAVHWYIDEPLWVYKKQYLFSNGPRLNDFNIVCLSHESHEIPTCFEIFVTRGLIKSFRPQLYLWIKRIALSKTLIGDEIEYLKKRRKD